MKRAKNSDLLVVLDRLREKLAEVERDLETALELLRRDRQRADVDDGELIGPVEAARILGCSLRSVRRWAREGRVPPPITLGRRPRWRRGEIEHLVRREGAA